jgi:hypothetical protein
LAKFSVIFSQNGDIRKEYCSTEAGHVIGITLDCAADLGLSGGDRCRRTIPMRRSEARDDAQRLSQVSRSPAAAE